jgi:hypothetical protein
VLQVLEYYQTSSHCIVHKFLQQYCIFTGVHISLLLMSMKARDVIPSDTQLRLLKQVTTLN